MPSGRLPVGEQRRPDAGTWAGTRAGRRRVEREAVQRAVAVRDRGREHRPHGGVLQDDCRRPWRRQAVDGVQMPEGVERRHVLAADRAWRHAGIADELIQRVAEVGDLEGAIRAGHRAEGTGLHPMASGKRPIRPGGNKWRPGDRARPRAGAVQRQRRPGRLVEAAQVQRPAARSEQHRPETGRCRRHHNRAGTGEGRLRRRGRGDRRRPGHKAHGRRHGNDPAPRSRGTPRTLAGTAGSS
jgi:hypothetical protein